MNTDRLTEALAVRALGWRVAPGRFLKPSREWIPAYKFQPFQRLADAFMLLERAADSFRLNGTHEPFTVEVQIGCRHVQVSGLEKARVISTAVARALQLDVEPGL